MTAIKRRKKEDLEAAILEAHYKRTGEASCSNAPSFSQLYPIWRAHKIRVKEHMETTAIRNDNCYKRYLQNPEGSYIFSTKGGETMMTQGSFASRLRRICKWAGVEFKSLHKIRKTVVTELMDHQLPLPLIQSQVGHASAQTTENCYHFNNKTKYENGRKIACALTDFLPLAIEA